MYEGMNVLYWTSIINYQLLPPHTQYTASSSRNAQLSQMELGLTYGQILFLAGILAQVM